MKWTELIWNDLNWTSPSTTCHHNLAYILWYPQSNTSLLSTIVTGIRCFDLDLAEDDEPPPEGEEEEEEEEEEEDDEEEVEEEDDEGMMGGGVSASGETTTLWPTSGQAVIYPP